MNQIHYDALYCGDNVIPESLRKNQSQKQVGGAAMTQPPLPLYQLGALVCALLMPILKCNYIQSPVSAIA